MPLLTGQERNWLREKQLAVSRALAPAGTQYAVAPTAKSSVETGEAVGQVLDGLRQWDELPLSLLLQSAAVDASPPLSHAVETAAPDKDATGNRGELARELLIKRLARQGAEVRRRLNELPDAAQRHLRETAKLLEDKVRAPGKVRAGDSQADLKV